MPVFRLLTALSLCLAASVTSGSERTRADAASEDRDGARGPAMSLRLPAPPRSTSSRTPTATGTSVYIALLQGGQIPEEQIPLGLDPSAAQGHAFLTLDRSSGVVCYSISHTALATETVSHFHGPAVPGEVNMNHFWPIAPESLPFGSPKVGCSDPLDAVTIDALDGGLWYLNIHSFDYPSGEIRGQVLPIAGVTY